MASQERTEYWEQQFQKFDESGLTKAAFCEMNQVALGSFYVWWRRLRGSCRKRQRKFVRAQIENVGSRGATVIFSGMEIHFEQLPDPAWLRSLCGGDL